MRPLVTADEYRKRVLRGIVALKPQRIPLDAAYGYILAAELSATRDLPPFPSSAMDGFAVQSADTGLASAEAPVVLELAGEVRMGRPALFEVARGKAVAVPTGGMLPAGADTVIPVELCGLAEGGLVVTGPSPPGHNVRPAGEDLRQGEVLVPAGRRLEAADLGALAAAGYSNVEATPRPRVAIVSTGDELVDPGTEPASGQICESNSFLLQGLVRRAGGEPLRAGRVPDDPAAVLEALTTAAPSADVFVCSGGVSVGRDDPVKRAFASSDAVSFLQVAVQPGRPQAFGTWLGKPFFGLPGNPMAALVAFELFVRPALCIMAGRDPQTQYVPATLQGNLGASADCVRYVPVRLACRGSEALAYPSGRRRSNQLAALAQADGLAEIPQATNLEPGSRCRVIRIRDG